MKDDKFTNYTTCLEYMYAQLPMFQRIGSPAYKKDLTNTIKLCNLIGNPQNRLKTIHIAGTNGKGTTTHIIAGGLQAQGYKVGVYTSPHYIDFRERIKINGVFIPKKYIISFVNTYRKHLEEIKPSFFEMTVALAFAYFADQKTDYAVIETGLGGRLDSTNIIRPLMSVITNISYDHQNLLGDTLEEIAYEKAGIIKKNIPVIIGERQAEVKQKFIQKAKELHAEINFAEDHLTLIHSVDINQGKKQYRVKVDNVTWIDKLNTDLVGPFQERNIITGLYTLYQLSKQIVIDAEKIKDFFPSLKKSTYYIGRWQILSHNPTIIADSAHNEGGLKIILSEIMAMSHKKLHIVLGFVNDKKLDKVLGLFPKDAIYYFAKANIPRGLPADELKTNAAAFGLEGQKYISVRKAYAAARKKAKPDDIVFIGGSIFVVAEIL
ncbi:MAG: bifunctional folylpolyglutamate synthase/dihydrofolate synthase [Saprospiraceae bacterium]|nr:bifunctional folylpolyglutamate synthase/dihydrofolate synthase [Saprospiraceae bacterium]